MPVWCQCICGLRLIFISFIHMLSVDTADVKGWFSATPLKCLAFTQETLKMNQFHRQSKPLKQARHMALIAGLISCASVFAVFANGKQALNAAPERHPSWAADNAYVTDIGTLLYHDRDNDGYFAGLSLTIDADTPYHEERIYASIDLTDINQITEPLHRTADFSIYGNSLSDEYRVDIDLVRNYPTGIYDLQITLHDARDNRILDSVGASHFSNLRQLPLESEDLDLVALSPVNDTTPSNVSPPLSNNDIRVSEYGGSTSLAFLALLLTSLAIRLHSRAKPWLQLRA